MGWKLFVGGTDNEDYMRGFVGNGGEENNGFVLDRILGGELCQEKSLRGPKGEDTLGFDKVSGKCWVLVPTDKTVSGEYVLARPPKKPGGVYLFLLMVSGAINCVEGKRDYDERYFKGFF